MVPRSGLYRQHVGDVPEGQWWVFLDACKTSTKLMQHNDRSQGTANRVLPHWTTASVVRPRDQRAVEAVHAESCGCDGRRKLKEPANADATQVMVIVDVRASGGRGDVGIPTDAYFAVEEIKDVSLAGFNRDAAADPPQPLRRTAPQPKSHSPTSHPLSKPRKPRRSASSTSCGTSSRRTSSARSRPA